MSNTNIFLKFTLPLNIISAPHTWSLLFDFSG